MNNYKEQTLNAATSYLEKNALRWGYNPKKKQRLEWESAGHLKGSLDFLNMGPDDTPRLALMKWEFDIHTPAVNMERMAQYCAYVIQPSLEVGKICLDFDAGYMKYVAELLILDGAVQEDTIARLDKAASDIAEKHGANLRAIAAGGIPLAFPAPLMEPSCAAAERIEANEKLVKEFLIATTKLHFETAYELKSDESESRVWTCEAVFPKYGKMCIDYTVSPGLVKAELWMGSRVRRVPDLLRAEASIHFLKLNTERPVVFTAGSEEVGPSLSICAPAEAFGMETMELMEMMLLQTAFDTKKQTDIACYGAQAELEGTLPFPFPRPDPGETRRFPRPDPGETLRIRRPEFDISVEDIDPMDMEEDLEEDMDAMDTMMFDSDPGNR